MLETLGIIVAGSLVSALLLGISDRIKAGRRHKKMGALISILQELVDHLNDREMMAQDASRWFTKNEELKIRAKKTARDLSPEAESLISLMGTVDPHRPDKMSTELAVLRERIRRIQDLLARG